MAFTVQAESDNSQDVRISDVPLLKTYASDPTFCKSGVFYVEHIVNPSQYNNFTLVNYELNVRVNIGVKNVPAYKFLIEYTQAMQDNPKKCPKLGCQITDRARGYVNIGIDDKKTVDWSKQPLGYRIETDGPMPF
jgi:hypothetical protein